MSWLSSKRTKSSYNNANKVIGGKHYSQATHLVEAIWIFGCSRDAAYTLNGIKVCLASCGSDVTYLWNNYNTMIQHHMHRDPNFLTNLMYKLDFVQQLFISKLYKQIIAVCEGPFLLDQALLYQYQADLEDIIKRLERDKVAHFIVLTELTIKFIVHKELSSEDYSILSPINLSSLLTVTATTKNRKQKLGNRRNKWCTDTDQSNLLKFYFGSNNKGKTNRAAVQDIKLKHQKKDGKKKKITSLCILFAIGLKCKNGNKCRFNHRIRKECQDLDNGDALVKKLDSVFNEIYKWRLTSSSLGSLVSRTVVSSRPERGRKTAGYSKIQGRSLRVHVSWY